MTPLSFDYPISVAILYLIDSENTLEIARNLQEALESRGHVVNMVRVNKKNWRKAIRTPGDVVFNQVEDPSWELHTKVGRALEMLGRAQVCYDLKSINITADKAFVKKKLVAHNVSTPQYRLLPAKFKKQHIRGLEYPLILKPAGEHASEGISQDSVVIDDKELQERVKYLTNRYGEEVLVEEFIEGDEFHVAVVGNSRRTVVLPYVGINYQGEFADNWEIFTYNAKWNKTSWEYHQSLLYCPATLGRKIDDKIEKIVKQAYNLLGCRDIARFDVRINNQGKPYILDVNINPSLSSAEDDECWLAASKLGWTYAQFIETLVAITYKRCYGRLPDRMRERQLLLEAGV